MKRLVIYTDTRPDSDGNKVELSAILEELADNTGKLPEEELEGDRLTVFDPREFRGIRFTTAIYSTEGEPGTWREVER